VNIEETWCRSVDNHVEQLQVAISLHLQVNRIQRVEYGNLSTILSTRQGRLLCVCVEDDVEFDVLGKVRTLLRRLL